MQDNINMARNKIINFADSTRPTEPVTKKYVEANFNKSLTADGFTMRDDISMGGHEIVGLAPTPSTVPSCSSRDYADTRYVQKDQDINFNNHKVYNLPTPTNNNDAATKKYVDDKKCRQADNLRKYKIKQIPEIDILYFRNLFYFVQEMCF